MAPNRRKKKPAKNDHIGSSPVAAIFLSAPPPPSGVPAETADHVHRKNQKGRVTANVWSRRFNGRYETECCPDCPCNQVREALLSFCEADESHFAAARWLTLEGLNPDTLALSFNPNSRAQMTEFLELIKTRDRHGGEITLTIVRSGPAGSFCIVLAMVMIITVGVGMTTLPSKHDGIHATFVSILSECCIAVFIQSMLQLIADVANVFCGVVNKVMNAIYKL